MKVLVTGATGFVGHHLGQELVKRGHEVIVLSRHPKEAKRDLAFCSQAVSLDTLSDADDVDAIVNLAGESVEGRWTKKKREKILSSRVNLTRKIVEFAAKVKPQVLMSTSAIGYYGDAGEELLSETAAKGEGFLADVCEKWEAEARKAEAHGVRTVILRFGMILGRDGGAFKKLLPIFKMGLGGPLGGGKQWISWIHVDDLVKMICFALERDSVQGVYNAVAPRAVRNREFAEALGMALSRPAFLPVPGFVLKLVLGEMSSMLLGSQRVDPSKIVNHGFSFHFVELDRAFKDLVL